MHPRQETTNAVDDSHQIDIDYPPPSIERNIVYTAAASYARVVAEDVQSSEAAYREVDQSLYLIGIGDVSARERSCAIERASHTFATLRVDVGNDDRCAAGGEELGGGLADAAGCTGDDGDFASE